MHTHTMLTDLLALPLVPSPFLSFYPATSPTETFFVIFLNLANTHTHTHPSELSLDVTCSGGNCP